MDGRAKSLVQLHRIDRATNETESLVQIAIKHTEVSEHYFGMLQKKSRKAPVDFDSELEGPLGEFMIEKDNMLGPWQVVFNIFCVYEDADAVEEEEAGDEQ